MQSIAVIATYGTILEVILIILIVFITVVFKMYSMHRERVELNLKNEIRTFISRDIERKNQITLSSFSDKWLDLRILLLTLAEVDRENVSGNWLYIRTNFIKNIILPLARTAASSNDWIMRHYAAISFALYSENADEKIILDLLNDTIPLVRYAAAGAGIRHGSELVINAIIVQISKESWLTQTMYMKGFVNIPFATHYFLENIMKKSDEFEIRSTTYNLLMKFPVFPVNWIMTDDMRSQQTLLTISAIRYLTYSKNLSSLETLLSLLTTPSWRVKAVVLDCLGSLKSDAAIPAVRECLADDNWWVRFSAAQALSEIGWPGQSRKGDRYLSTNQFNIDVSEHILNTF